MNEKGDPESQFFRFAAGFYSISWDFRIQAGISQFWDANQCEISTTRNMGVTYISRFDLQSGMGIVAVATVFSPPPIPDIGIWWFE